MSFNNVCWGDTVTWASSAADIDYTLLHTWTAGSSNSEVDSVASTPTWSDTSGQCVRSFNLQVLKDDGTWSEISTDPRDGNYLGVCSDTASGATDGQGSPEDCSYYAGNPDDCNAYNDADFNAGTMCCECGGGSTACGITAGMSTCTFATDYPWMQWTARTDLDSA